jgi:flagellar basal body-associated protein FliL
MRVRAPLLAVVLLAGFAAPAMAAGGGSGSSSAQQQPASRQDRLTSAESYVPMPTLSAGVLQRMSTRGTLVVDMGLDVPNADLRTRARLNGPRLRDSLRTALATYASTYYSDRTAPDPEELTRLMQQAVNRTLGAEGAQVLMVNIIYQRRAN